MNAYNELYLSDAKRHLSTMFDYAINECKFSPDFFYTLFSKSQVAKQYENGNPLVISGLSGYELVQNVVDEFYVSKILPESVFHEEKSPEYWAGWAISQYQWYYAKSFKKIGEIVSFSKIIEMYPLYHEMDISHFFEQLNLIFEENKTETNLKKLRETAGLSQSELAKKSGVNLRNIQMYEQRQNDIDKAQVCTLRKISKVLMCSIEELLENI